MRLKELFNPADFLIDFAPADKWEAIGRLMDHLVAAGHVEEESAPAYKEQVLELSLIHI